MRSHLRMTKAHESEKRLNIEAVRGIFNKQIVTVTVKRYYCKYNRMITVENCMITCIFILTSCSNDLIHDKYIQLATANWSFRVGVFPSA